MLYVQQPNSGVISGGTSSSSSELRRRDSGSDGCLPADSDRKVSVRTCNSEVFSCLLCYFTCLWCSDSAEL